MPRRAAPKPKPEWWPETDRLLRASEARSLVGVTKGRWRSYVERYDTLSDGERTVFAHEGATRGSPRWLLSAVLRHIHEELAGGEVRR